MTSRIDDPVRSLLAAVEDNHPDRAAILEAERRAIADGERPGSWFGEDGADGRLLTQEATDMFIRDELRRRVEATSSAADRDELLGILGAPQVVLLTMRGLPEPDPDRTDRFRVATIQRGGIDSDPLVRLLAYRAWGDRDRRWFEDRGVRKGDRLSDPEYWTRSEPSVVVALPGEVVLGIAVHNALPGEYVEIEPLIDGPYAKRGTLARVGDRPRGGSGVQRPGEPSSCDATMCELFGFDRLQHEYVPEKRWTVLTAECGGYRTATRVSDAWVTRAAREVRNEACFALARELGRLGAMRVRAPDYLRQRDLDGWRSFWTDPAVIATLFVDLHDLIEAALLSGTPDPEVAEDLALTVPMPLDDAHQLVAMATTARVRAVAEILTAGPSDDWTDPEIGIDEG